MLITTNFDGMPKSPHQMGLVDTFGSPRDITLRSRLYLERLNASENERRLTFNKKFSIINKYDGLELFYIRALIVRKRIFRRMTLLRYELFDDFLSILT